MMLALKEMRELEEARRKEANSAMDRFLQMLAERESREAAAWAKEMAEERAEAAEARRQQAAFQQSFLDLFTKLVEGKQASVPPTLEWNLAAINIYIYIFYRGLQRFSHFLCQGPHIWSSLVLNS